MTYRLAQCATCHAPVLVPFPADWHVDLIKVGPPMGPVDCVMTPHRRDCQEPLQTLADDEGRAIRVPGRCVADVGLSFGAASAD